MFNFKKTKKSTVVEESKSITTTSETETDKEKKLAESYKLTMEGNKIKQEIKESENNISKSEEGSKTFLTLLKMGAICHVMTATFSQDSNLGTNRVFSDDDLIEYKRKMLELLNKL